MSRSKTHRAQSSAFTALVTKSYSSVFGNAPGGVRPCVARYAPGFLHRENVDDFIFAKEEPNQSGHPIRITMFKPPKDGEAIIGCEYGGYRAPAGTWERKHGVIKDVTFYKPGDRLPTDNTHYVTDAEVAVAWLVGSGARTSASG